MLPALWLLQLLLSGSVPGLTHTEGKPSHPAIDTDGRSRAHVHGAREIPGWLWAVSRRSTSLY